MRFERTHLQVESNKSFNYFQQCIWNGKEQEKLNPKLVDIYIWKSKPTWLFQETEGNLFDFIVETEMFIPTL